MSLTRFNNLFYLIVTENPIGWYQLMHDGKETGKVQLRIALCEPSVSKCHSVPLLFQSCARVVCIVRLLGNFFSFWAEQLQWTRVGGLVSVCFVRRNKREMEEEGREGEGVHGSTLDSIDFWAWCKGFF